MPKPDQPREHRHTLGLLADPDALHDPLDIRGSDPLWLSTALRGMWLIRRVEESIADMVAAKQVQCPCHLAIGQEAVAVGVARSVEPGDRIFGAHRSHAHFLSLGGNPFELFAEVLGREQGCSRGMGGSMHLTDPYHGLLGTVPLVAATIPIAVGAGLAAQMDGNSRVAVSFFGDGAAEEGVFHESMNFAASMRLPVVFVCENNLFSSHLHISLRQPSDCIARYALAHGMPGSTVDGNDVWAVAQAASQAFMRARRGDGPSLLEAVTYRWRGHVGHREDIDVGVQRKGDLARWKKRDPIDRLACAMVQQGWLDAEQLNQVNREVDAEVNDARLRATQAAFPPASSLLGLVYSS